MDTLNNRPSVLVASADQVAGIQQAMALDTTEGWGEDTEGSDGTNYTSLATYISSIYQENKDYRKVSGMEEKMFQSLRAYNGHYDPEDLAIINEGGGSSIYMNLTPTKCRAAMSWIRDIMMPAKENAWGLEPTADPTLPDDIKATIEEAITRQAETMASQPAPPPNGQAAPQGQPALDATQKLQDINQIRRDIEDAVADEILKIATSGVKRFERIVADQLQEGGWDEAFSNFIEDFCVFPVAILKGPVITKKKVLSYVNGGVEETEKFIFLNKRVSPFDLYPSADSTSTQDGDLCEHLRFDKKTLYNMIGVNHYKEEVIREILVRCAEGGSSEGLDTNIEPDKVTEEYRGDSTKANKNTIHGVHFHGSIPWKYLNEWEFDSTLIGDDEDRIFEVEAILADGEVIKCVLNDDPLLRRPYYKASFQSIPGSFWGRSLPELMRDIQRMCNATARALANNMAMASGPQIEIYTDRLADDTEISDIKPFQIWQLTSDPSGAGGRAINFWQPTSNAQELLAVYKEFELRADDATGIPRYAYGNDRNGGSAQTAAGLSMLLESAAKGIKDSVRNIDFGVIKPRIEYQFYWNVISNDDVTFTGDINVVPRGSEILTTKGSSEMRRNEFLQILANPNYVGIVGIEGVADILREMAKSLGLGRNIIPSRVELRRKEEENKQKQAQEAQANSGADKTAASLQATQIQIDGQKQMHSESLQLKAEELKLKASEKAKDQDIKIADIQSKREMSVNKGTADLQKQQMVEANKSSNVDKSIALSLKTGDKSNMQS